MAAFMAAVSFIGVKHYSTASNVNTLNIQLEHYVGSNLLQLDSQEYKNNFGQSYTVSKFKYYISHITLKNKNGNDYVSDDYFLVNEEDADSKQLVLANIPSGDYTSLSYMVGVDSLHNCSGAQSGALDPMNAMFWAWNTGYIFMKMEGHSPKSQSPGHILEFHIGGYKQPNNCIRIIKLNLPEVLHITTGKANRIKIKTDVGTLFQSPTAIDFSRLSSVTDFHNAKAIADNYIHMFSILSTE